ncbi:MAG TPA: AMP-binding protein [Thermomicrobiales bacterium]|nr:AMP-binding protein [Thermomicrobiales bacterium]
MGSRETAVYAAPGALQDALARRAATRPDQPFIVEAETGRTLTYGQCRAAVGALRRELGAAPRQIALALPGGIVNGVVWLAALTGGHLLVPLAPDAADAEKARVTRRAAPDVLVVERADDAGGFARPRATVLTRAAVEALIARAAADGAGDALPPAVEGRLLLTTSGSTGEPKGVLLTERQVAWTADAIRAGHGLTPADRGLTVLPFFHINAPVVSLCASLLAGSTVVIAARFSRTRFWSWVADYRVTWASIVPTILAMLLETERPGFLPGDLRFVRTASARLPVAHLEAFEDRFGVPVVETYGLSEAASQIVANPVPPGRRKPGAAGLPAGVALRVCRPRTPDGPPELVDVAPGDIGEVCVRGPNLIAAYQGGVGRESFQDGWFRTGDLGRRDGDGYLFLTGRLREMIKRGGETIAPREVEEVLLAHPDVREVAVVGRPDALYGEVVVALAILRDDCWPAAALEDLRRFAADRLRPALVPVEFIPVREFPKTATNKLDRRALTEAARYVGSSR